MIYLKKFKLIIKILSSLYPFIFFNLFFLKKKNLLVKKNTDIVIEGFPRSGNTFCTISINKFQKQKFILSHHSHSPANVKKAIKYKIPVIILIRDPEPAIRSLMIMYPFISSSLASFWYYLFYRSLQSIISNILIVDFDTLINKFQIVLEKFNNKFDASLIVHNISDEDRTEVFEAIKKIKNSGPTCIAIPHIDRAKKKEEVIIDKENLWFRKAEKIYLKYMNSKLT